MATLKREASKILSELQYSKEAVFILVALNKAEQAINRGETLSNIEAKKKMDKWLN